MSAHTPGPWISHDIGDDSDPDCGWWVVDLPFDNSATHLRFHVADMENATGTDLRNADLMAAAPDLLAALIAAEKGLRHGGKPAWLDALADNCLAVIAKATNNVR